MFAHEFAALMILFGILLTPTGTHASGCILLPPAGSSDIRKGTVRTGETASTLLNPHLPLKTIFGIARQIRDVFPLSRIQTGRAYTIILKEGCFSKFEYEIDRKNRLVIQKQGDRFFVLKTPIDYETRTEFISSIITSSLFEAVRKSGEKMELAGKLADIFAWDIDFIRDIRSGDRFQVLVEKQYHEGKLLEYGKVKAAVFSNMGRLFKAFLHEDSNGGVGYYDENGNSLQKAFLKAPLAFSRISSRFNLKRMHPVLKEVRAHPAVDYAAPAGTPIKTVGDGVIQKMGFSRTMGNFMVIRHCGGYITRYYHMSRFARQMGKGKKIMQGEIIGYVGMTGYATGPHLCFRMLRNGKPVDPLNHECPSASPVAPQELEQFLARTKKLFKEVFAALDPKISKQAA